MAENKIVSVACGILYDYSFTLLDKWGRIADLILYNNKYFSSDYFPKISSQYTTERMLYNDDKEHSNSLKLTANNLIYTHVITGNFQKEFDTFKERVIKFIIPKIIEDNELHVLRIGVVFSCSIPEVGINEFALKYFKEDMINGISDFRFSKKEAVNGAVWNDNNDFINKIYTVGSISDNYTGISFDYQMHYRPAQVYIKDGADKFFETGKKLLFEDVLNVDKKNVK